MADGFTVEITNRAAFDAALDAAKASLAAPDAAVADGARTLAAAGGAPHLTGRLASAGTVTGAGPGRARITVNTAYAAAIHWGWPGHNIRRRPWLVGRFRSSPGPLDAVSAGIQKGLDHAAAKT